VTTLSAAPTVLPVPPGTSRNVPGQPWVATSEEVELGLTFRAPRAPGCFRTDMRRRSSLLGRVRGNGSDGFEDQIPSGLFQADRGMPSKCGCLRGRSSVTAQEAPVVVRPAPGATDLHVTGSRLLASPWSRPLLTPTRPPDADSPLPPRLHRHRRDRPFSAFC